MTEGPLLGKMILFALPVIASGILQLLFNTADIMVVGRFSGDAAMAAVGCCTSIIHLVINLFIGLSVGAGVVAAHDLGAKRYDDVRRLTGTALTASLVGGVAVGLFGFFAAEPLLVLMKTPADVLPEAVPYMKAYFVGIPGCLVYNYLAAILRSSGDTRRPLFFLTAAGVVNVALNLVMVCGFGMGALGVGIATAVSQYVSAVLILIFMIRTDGPCRLARLSVDGEKLRRMIAVGLPAGIQSCLFSFSNVLIQSTVNGYPTAVVAGNTAAGNLEGYIYTSMNALYQTSVTFVGQNVGAGTYRRIKRITLECIAIVTVVGVVMGGGMLLLGDKLLSLYTSGEASAAVIEAGMNRLWVIVSAYFLCGVMEVGCGVMRGMGYAIQPMVVSLVGSCLFRVVWIYTVCPLFPDNIMALYFSYPISWTLTATTHLIFCYFAYRKLIRTQNTENERTLT